MLPTLANIKLLIRNILPIEKIICILYKSELKEYKYKKTYFEQNNAMSDKSFQDLITFSNTVTDLMQL